MTAQRTFECMGTTCAIVLTGTDAAGAAEAAEARVRALAATLTRFDPDSELSRVNADPRPVVPASAAVRALFRAAAWAAGATGGLVDAALLDGLERAGYTRSRAGAPSADLADALARAPLRRPARARGAAAGPPVSGSPPVPAGPPVSVSPPVPAGPPLSAPPPDAPWWTLVSVDDAAGVVARPPGLRIDPGGIAKGLIADLVLAGVAQRPLAFVDCGGDVAVGGARAAERPWRVAVRHPADGSVAHTFTLAHGGVATSGLARRLWLRADGTPAHHLLDPSTGEPAWTGLLSATAVAAGAVEAEALAKAAYLSGPAGARAVLAARGGLLVHEDGRVELA